MGSLRAHLQRSGGIAWASLFVLAATQVALFVEVGGREHGFCAEHTGAVHHLDGNAESAAELQEGAVLALRAPQPKKSIVDSHDHCDLVGAGLRPLVKPGKACTPRIFERQTPKKALEIKAKPISTEPVYALAPKTSPPQA